VRPDAFDRPWLAALTAAALVACGGGKPEGRTHPAKARPAHGSIQVDRPDLVIGRSRIGSAPGPDTPPVPIPALPAAGCLDAAAVHAYAKALQAENDQRYLAAVEGNHYRQETRKANAMRSSDFEGIPDRDPQLVIVGGVDGAEVRGETEVELLVKERSVAIPVRSPIRHTITLWACGTNPCGEPGRGAEVEVLPLVTRLEDGESLVDDLWVEYDGWYVAPAYERFQDCYQGDPPP